MKDEKRYEAFVVGDGIYRLDTFTGELIYVNPKCIPSVDFVLPDKTTATSLNTQKK